MRILKLFFRYRLSSMNVDMIDIIIDRQIDRWIDIIIDRQIDRQILLQIDRQIDRKIDGRLLLRYSRQSKYHDKPVITFNLCDNWYVISAREDGQTDRYYHRQIDTQMDHTLLLRYRRSSKYHDKPVDTFNLCDNGYMVTASAGSRFTKIWKVSASNSIFCGEWGRGVSLSKVMQFLLLILSL